MADQVVSAWVQPASSPAVSWAQAGSPAIVTLERRPINGLDQDVLDELMAAFDEVDTEPAVRVVVIASGIDGIFCSGGDLQYWSRIADGRRVGAVGRSVFARLERLSKPTIAVISGHTIGDGLSLALACDLRIAAESASFRLPEAAYGFIPGWGTISRLVATVGRAQATQLLLTGQPVDAARALAIGLVHEVVPANRLLDAAVGKAELMATLSPTALRAAKCVLAGGDEAACFEAIWGGADWQIGMDAAHARRPATFEARRVCCADAG